jgi:hypothetical protein
MKFDEGHLLVLACLYVVFLLYPHLLTVVNETPPRCDEYIICCDDKYPECARCCPDQFHDWRSYKKMHTCEWLIRDIKEQNGTCFIGKTNNLRKNITPCVMKTTNWESDCIDE